MRGTYGIIAHTWKRWLQPKLFFDWQQAATEMYVDLLIAPFLTRPAVNITVNKIAI